MTYHHDNSRNGYDTSLANVTSPSVAWKSVVDGPVYAEPLFYKGSVYVATENDTVYALSATNGGIKWSRHLGTPANSTKPPWACNGGNGPNIKPMLGITGTPAIDPASGTIYAVPMINGSGYRLFALNVDTGQVKWSVLVSLPGFNYTAEEERSALTIANGLVYIPFGGFSYDCEVPRGWVVAYSLNGNGTEYDYMGPGTDADLWTPSGLSVDGSGFLYGVTGDGDARGPPFDYSDAVIKFAPHLAVVGYFAPTNWVELSANDLDLGSTGATMLPGNLVFSIGKEGTGYLLSNSNLGGIGGQLFSSKVCDGGAWGGTAFAAGIIYVPCAGGVVALKVQAGTQPQFTTLWNYSGFFAGPPIIAGGAVWTFDIYAGTLYAINPTNGTLISKISLGSVGFVEHFTTPSVGGRLLLFAATDTIYALNP